MGGGTAAWMTANLFAHKWQKLNVEITVIEAPDIATIGVGEGSTPYLRSFFKQLGIKESDWMPACNATYKCGIKFVNWSSRPGFSSYFHPFNSDADSAYNRKFEHNTWLKRQGYDVDVQPDDFYMMAALAKQQKLPIKFNKSASDSEGINAYDNPHHNIYAYHFDSALLGQYLKQHAQTQLQVNYCSAKIIDIKQQTNGDIKSVFTDTQQELSADLFVDCTGFSSLLIQKSLNVPFISFANNLFNDSAVAVSTPHSHNAASYTPQTVSTAMSCGWRWQIPLQSRNGNGYVYSSTYQSSESAEQELRQSLKLTDDTEVKHLKMRVGRLDKHWQNNCLAIGLSQGFIEPLEATALHLVQDSIERFLDVYDFNPNLEQEEQRDHFNELTNYGFERVRDYIVLHYIMNSKDQSAYWQNGAQLKDISTELAHLLGVWFNGQDLREELAILNLDQYYGSTSWHALLAGYGVFPDSYKGEPDKRTINFTLADEARQYYARLTEQYPPAKINP